MGEYQTLSEPKVNGKNWKVDGNFNDIKARQLKHVSWEIINNKKQLRFVLQYEIEGK